MPHLNIEYSANLDQALDIQALVDRIHEAALETVRGRSRVKRLTQ